MEREGSPRWPMGKVSSRVLYGNSIIPSVLFYRVLYIHNLDIRRMHGDRPI